MTYIVYADVLFVYHVLIQLALLFMIQTILGHTIRIFRTLSWSILMAALSTGIFLITISRCTLYYIIYATSYFFMTYFFTKSCRLHTSMLVTGVVVLACCIWFAGMMQIFYIRNEYALHNPWFYMCCTFSVLTCRIGRMIYDQKQQRKNTYQVALILPGAKICAHAFVDTGNRLQNPYTGKPAIIINYRLLKNYLPEQSYENLEQYHRTGKFPYLQINGTGNLHFFPIPYHTIGNRFSLMPAIMVPELLYEKEQTRFFSVTAGISRDVFLGNQYEVLLHEKLQPMKEEPA